MRSYINEGALKPKSIPSQIPNFSVVEFEGWEFSAQKETNTLSPKTKADDVFKSLFKSPRNGTVRSLLEVVLVTRISNEADFEASVLEHIFERVDRIAERYRS